METVNEIKERLSASSRTATLDELRSEGRKQVRLIRAEHIAAMVSEAVHAAIEESGLIDSGEHERLVEKSREEFKAILAERQEEARNARDVEMQLATCQDELAELKGRFAELTRQLTSARAEADEAREQGGAPAAGASPSNELIMSMFREMAEMKASMQGGGAGAAPAAGAAAGAGAGAAPPADFGAALEKLTSSLNSRLESIGKKMGVSSAVDDDTPVDFSGMFKDMGDALESNMDDIVVKKKAGGGIAANLARLKKLKGGG